MQMKQHNPKMKIDFSLFGFSFLFAALLTLCHNTSPIADFFGRNTHVAFIVNALIGAIVAGMVLFLLARVKPSVALPALNETRLYAYSFFGCTLMVLGLLSYLSLFAFNLPLTVIRAGGLCFGAGAMMLCVMWGYLYAMHPLALVLRYSAVGLIGVAVLYSVSSSVLDESTLLLCAALEVLISMGCVFFVPKGAPTEEVCTVSENQRPLVALLSFVWKPLCGVFLCAFIFGLIWDPSMAQLSVQTVSLRLEIFVGATLALVGCLVLFACKPDLQATSVLCRFGLPHAAAVLLVLPSLEVADSALWASVLGVVREGCFVLVFFTLWMLCIEAVQRLGVSARFVFSFCFSVVCAGALLGVALIPFVGLGGRTLALVGLAAYLAALAFAFTRKDVTHKTIVACLAAEENQEVKGAKTPEFPFDQRCEHVAHQAKLSPRETEVFSYLARGHSHVYIAKKLFLSENTVRTHVRNLYRKLGISSKEELIALIDCEA
ncbi:MAG: helix-turn-helix transcriptional regulator [Raoultibacter sp.]